MKKLFFSLRQAWLALTSPAKKTYVADVCKHTTKLKGTIPSKDGTCILEMPLNQNGHPDYCLECVSKMGIRCAWCGESILVGDPVTLYVPKDDFKIPPYAMRYDKDPQALVGCLRWNCALTGADRSGFWVPPGKVERVPSPLELAFASNMVIVEDLSDQKNLGSVYPRN